MLGKHGCTKKTVATNRNVECDDNRITEPSGKIGYGQGWVGGITNFYEGSQQEKCHKKLQGGKKVKKM